MGVRRLTMRGSHCVVSSPRRSRGRLSRRLARVPSTGRQSSRRLEFGDVATVARDVGRELRKPVVRVRLRARRVGGARVPEAPVDEYRKAKRGERDVHPDPAGGRRYTGGARVGAGHCAGATSGFVSRRRFARILVLGAGWRGREVARPSNTSRGNIASTSSGAGISGFHMRRILARRTVPATRSSSR